MSKLYILGGCTGFIRWPVCRPGIYTEDTGMRFMVASTPNSSITQLHFYILRKENKMPVAPWTNREMVHFSPLEFCIFLGHLYHLHSTQQ